MLVVMGLLLAGIGLLILLAQKLHLPLGHLPGDIVYRGRHSTVYFPWVSMLVISIILTLIINFFRF